jgi:hypothetical protein
MMLQLKETKNLVQPLESTYADPFDIQLLQSADGTKLFEVEIDPVNHLVILTITVEEQSFMLTLAASQAVSVGQWLLEAGYVVNFTEKAGIQFEGDSDE